MKTKLLRRIRKRFDIKYTDNKYQKVIIHDNKIKYIIDFPNIQEAINSICYSLDINHYYLNWANKRYYLKQLKIFKNIPKTK